MLYGEVADVIMAWWKGDFVSMDFEGTIHLINEFFHDTGLYIDDKGLMYEFPPPGTRRNLESRRTKVEP